MEFGKLSPVNINCSDGDIKLDDLVSPTDITLLNDLFGGRIEFTDKEKDRLTYLDKYLDKYLDIPLVEAVLNPSYDALYRLLENNCKNIPVSLKMYVSCMAAAKMDISMF